MVAASRGELIPKRLMHENNTSAAKLSRETGVPASTISEWLSKTRKEPKFNESILKVAKFFSVPVEYLLTGEHPEEQLIKGFVENLEEGFVSLHQGVYRLKIEKYVGKKGGK